MRSFALSFGYILIVIGAMLVFFGVSAWPPSGLMFALPYVLLLPGGLLVIVGILIAVLANRRGAPRI